LQADISRVNGRSEARPRVGAAARLNRGLARWTFVVFTQKEKCGRYSPATTERSIYAREGDQEVGAGNCPRSKREKEAAKILDKDLTTYTIGENLAPYPFEYTPKQKSGNLRISEELLNAVRIAARRRRIPYPSARRWKLPEPAQGTLTAHI